MWKIRESGLPANAVNAACLRRTSTGGAHVPERLVCRGQGAAGRTSVSFARCLLALKALLTPMHSGRWGLP